MNDDGFSRRNFLKSAPLATALGLAIPQIVSTAFTEATLKKRVSLNDGDVILFQGDSITDAGRKKDDTGVNNASALGSGYALFAASDLLLDHPDKHLQIYNRGISGN